MRLPTDRFVFVFVAALLVAAAAGCTSPAQLGAKIEARGGLRLDASTREIGVTVLEPGVPFHLREPTAKAEATFTTAREAARETLIGGGEAAMLFPASFVIGGLAGATFGVNAEKIRHATQAIERAVAEIALPARASEAFLSVAARHASVNAARIADDFPLPRPRAAQRHGSQRGGAQASTTGAPVRPGAAQDRGAAAAGSRDQTLHPGTDALVSVRVFFQGFQVAAPDAMPLTLRNAYNPPLQILLAVSFAGVRASDGAELGGISVHYTSMPRSFTAWAADDAVLFRRELAIAQREIAAAVAERVNFLPAGS